MGPEAVEVANRAVVLAGSARSGTSLLCAILASLDGAELDYESPVLTPLLASEASLVSATFQLMWTRYVHRSVVVDALAGRSLNLNWHDESSAYRYLGEEEIARRLSRSWGLRDLLDRSIRARPVLKMPNVVEHLTRVAVEFPGTRFVVTGREPSRTILSLVTRGWFRDAVEGPSLTTSPVRVVRGVRVPYWVPSYLIDRYVSGTDLQRSAMYYVWVTEASLTVPGAILVDYAALTEDPEPVVTNCAGRLGMTFGPRTRQLISQVEERAPVGDVTILSSLSSNERDEVETAWGRWRAATQADAGRS